jgi:hypothetical protein
MSIAPQGHPGHLLGYDESSTELALPLSSSISLQVGDHSLCVTVQGPALNSNFTTAVWAWITTSVLRLIERHYITRFVVYRSTTGSLANLRTWRVRNSDLTIRRRGQTILTA